MQYEYDAIHKGRQAWDSKDCINIQQIYCLCIDLRREMEEHAGSGA